ncbi:LysR family transcriptional regulator [Thiomonas bhubaneswarensis]|uniref:Transcriptional regulator, LysR family n=1 Tax=Thiomonas bhubaneswarensis TaxID=339866 RepID=A0A0K6HZD0_9BURK|nr:LysR family transcriptional regulator [Thiomonas bhubaneswarensis]CUA96397.1 transcriptional regulator, LysR family [Thiomonas bhubaneswarensis]
MRTFDPECLRALVAVAHSGSLSAAAQRLYRSQSAVSEQIRKLELACSATLLLRSKRGAELTPAGRTLLGHAQEILDAHERAVLAMQGVDLAGSLRVAVTDYFHPSGIAALLRRLRASHPRLQLHVTVRKSASIEQEADEEPYDLGLSMRILERGATRGTPSGVLRVPLFREPMAWVADPSLQAAAGGALPLVVLPASCAVHRFVARALAARNIEHYVAHCASGVAGLQLAISAGLGVSCLNASALPAGLRPLRSFSGIRLPSLPQVEFALLVPQAGQSALIDEVVPLLAQVLRAAVPMEGDAAHIMV